MLVCFLCQSNAQNAMKTLKNRRPVFAGQFYPEQKKQLEKELNNLFSGAAEPKCTKVKAIIVPHAGYVFSGQIAASGYAQISSNKKFERVFVLASSHRVRFNGASIYSIGNYETPLGEVKVDRELAKELMEQHSVFSYYEAAHSEEHSLEVQLPFLQYQLGDFTLIPIVIGTDNLSQLDKIAAALKPYFTEENLFVISSDFSHYPEYNSAKEVDMRTANSIIENNSEAFLKTIRKNAKQKIPNLATSICGWTSVYALLKMSEGEASLKYKKIAYQNSGDSRYGDHDRVVGYWSIVLYEDKPDNELLSETDKTFLLHLARTTIEHKLKKKEPQKLNKDELSEVLKKPLGAFVTLHIHKKLRGCIGRFQPSEPLYKVVEQMAVEAAFHDPRFDALKPEEINDIDIEISVLTPLKRIQSENEIVLGKHGVYLKQGYRSGTFLPQVADQTGWTLEEFLGHLSRDKAGITWDGWKHAELYTYEAIVFSEKEMDEFRK